MLIIILVASYMHIRENSEQSRYEIFLIMTWMKFLILQVIWIL